jgi:hypothetical protein
VWSRFQAHPLITVAITGLLNVGEACDSVSTVAPSVYYCLGSKTIQLHGWRIPVLARDGAKIGIVVGIALVVVVVMFAVAFSRFGY